MSTYTLAVVGNPIAHSLSPPIHQAFAASLGLSVSYSKLLAALPEENAAGFASTVADFFHQGGHGLNVTVPFKQTAFALCENRLTDRAKTAQAVNTLYMQNGQLCGDNTDGAGLVAAINQLSDTQSWQLKNSRIAMIGAGGAARGVMLPLVQAGIGSMVVANRTLAKAQSLVADMAEHSSIAMQATSIDALSGEFDLIINATSSSLYGTALPLHPQLNCTHAYDMVYQKDGSLTPFLQHFQAKGASVSDGFGMLIGQAAISFAMWTGKQPNLHDEQLMNQLAKIIQP